MDNTEKECLIELIKCAKGNLTLDDFSERTGISKFQLSRILNGKFKEIPRKSTLSVIAEHSVDKFAKEVFQFYLSDQILVPDGNTMKKIPNDNLTSLIKWIKEENFIKSLKKIIHTCKGILLSNLSEMTFDWTVKYQEVNSSIPVNLQPILEIGTNGHGGIENWIFYFEPNEEQYNQGFFYTFLGRIMCESIPQNNKVSLIVSSLEVYDKLILSPPPNLNFAFSILLINLETQIIDNEHVFSFSPGTTDKQSNEISIAELTNWPDTSLLPDE